MTYETKDSGQRQEYDSGMRRDTQDGKARFDLLLPEGVAYSDQFFTRLAELMTRGAVKYGDRNWEKANSSEELERFKNSALRHLMQWFAGERDEDHAAAVVFNLLAYETTALKIEKTKNPLITIWVPEPNGYVGDMQIGETTTTNAPETPQDDCTELYPVGRAICKLGASLGTHEAYVVASPGENGVGQAAWAREGISGGRFRFDVADWVPVP